MLKYIDNFLNQITMYRLVLYVLVALVVAAFGLSFFGVLPYNPGDLVASTFLILFVSWLTNTLFSKVYSVPVNTESVYITAFILILVITPPSLNDSLQYLSLAIWASVWAIASKFIFAIKRKHIFNPVALAIFLVALALNESASWWVGTKYMLPFVLIGGLLIVQKIRRFDLVLSFLITALVTTTVGFWLIKDVAPLTSLSRAVFDSALFFFAFIMLTEPLTTPPTRGLRIAYGALVGFLFSPIMHIGSLYSTPEIALLLGNIFSYIVSPKEKFILKLKESREIALDTYEFVFSHDNKFSFRPGEYMEWTLEKRDPDSRGNRRYFTIASSPTEKDIKLGIKFYPEPSSFKNRLLYMKPGDTIIAAQRGGDFVMPKNNEKKLVFIAGGIGVTPFRSMVQFLVDTKEQRNIRVLYANKSAENIAYKDVFDSAYSELGIRTTYVVSDLQGDVLPLSNTRKGFIDEANIKDLIPDYDDCVFYISGPQGMVSGTKTLLEKIGVKTNNIKTDYFPGFA